MARRDPFSILGIERTSDAQAVKAAFRELAKRWHPDRCSGREGDGKRSAASRAGFTCGQRHAGHRTACEA